MSNNGELAPKKRRAIATLLEPGATQAQAADAAGVNPRTITRWLKEPDFQAGLDIAQRALLSTTMQQLTSLGTKAVRRLNDALDGNATSEQRRAADSVLKHILAMRQAIDFDERLTAIEQQVGVGE